MKLGLDFSLLLIVDVLWIELGSFVRIQFNLKFKVIIRNTGFFKIYTIQSNGFIVCNLAEIMLSYSFFHDPSVIR